MRKHPEVSCLYGGRPDVVSPLPYRTNGFMDSPSLDSLRQDIDAIDGELHGLIQRRAALVDRIAGSKPPGGLALRPGREAKVMRQRLETHQGPFPAAAVYRIERKPGA